MVRKFPDLLDIRVRLLMSTMASTMGRLIQSSILVGACSNLQSQVLWTDQWEYSQERWQCPSLSLEIMVIKRKSMHRKLKLKQKSKGKEFLL